MYYLKVTKYAVNTAHNEFFTDTWNKKNKGSFLRGHDLNNETIASVIECTTNCKFLTDVENDPELNGDPQTCARVIGEEAGCIRKV
jgi:hypothetical protein